MAAMLLLLAGCQTERPYLAKTSTAPNPVHCFDAVGHQKGAKPFILGGTCCCTPTERLMEQYHADGLLTDMKLANLLRLYEERGIKTSLDHHECNNLCQYGPHVVKGGKCMVSPTPGTWNYEEIRFAVKYAQPLPEGKKPTSKPSQNPVAGTDGK
jgi:hypothetical protein